MHLLRAIASGMRGASGGTVEIFDRGTGVRASVYGDQAGSVRLVQPITLGSYGESLVFVDGLVDVVVRDANGDEVITFTDGIVSESVSISSESFTDKTIKKVLSSWEDSSGAKNFNVLIDSESDTLENVASLLFDNFYFIDSEEFGAQEGGAFNCSPAISLAIETAAANGGGIVMVPPGDFLVTSLHIIPESVCLMGMGRGVSRLLMEGSACLSFVGSNRFVCVSNLSLLSHNGKDEPIIKTLDGAKVKILECEINGESCISEVIRADGSLEKTLILISDCDITCGHAGAAVSALTSFGSRVSFVRCRFVVGSDGGSVLLGSFIHSRSCSLEYSGTPDSESEYVFYERGDFVLRSSFVDNTIDGNPSAENVTAYSLGNLASGDFFSEESTTRRANDVDRLFRLTNGSYGYYCAMHSVAGRPYRTSSVLSGDYDHFPFFSDGVYEKSIHSRTLDVDENDLGDLVFGKVVFLNNSAITNGGSSPGVNDGNPINHLPIGYKAFGVGVFIGHLGSPGSASFYGESQIRRDSQTPAMRATEGVSFGLTCVFFRVNGLYKMYCTASSRSVVTP